MVNIRTKALPDQELLLQYFDYDPISGKLYHKLRDEMTFSSDASFRRHCTLFVGKEAGHLHSTKPKAYLAVKVDGIKYLAHRLIIKMVTGIDPIEGDHKDGNGLNNAWDNIRPTDALGNARNHRLQSNNTSGSVGVTWAANHNKWRAQIVVQKKHIFLGHFDSLQEAVKVRKSAEEKYGFFKEHGQVRPI